MILHKYKCDDPDDDDFYTTFEPYFDERPAYCPTCGKDYTVSYVGAVEVDVHDNA